MPRDIENSKRIKREHYVRNREHYIKKAYERTQEVKKEIRQWLGDYLKQHPCIDCGQDDIVVLDFDHKDNCGKEFNVSAGISLSISLDRIKREVAKCDVRCANCHKRKTAKQFGWWRINYTPSDPNGVENTDSTSASSSVAKISAPKTNASRRPSRPYKSRIRAEPTQSAMPKMGAP